MNDKLYDIEQIITHGYGKTARELAIDIVKLYDGENNTNDLFQIVNNPNIDIGRKIDCTLLGYDFSRQQVMSESVNHSAFLMYTFFDSTGSILSTLSEAKDRLIKTVETIIKQDKYGEIKYFIYNQDSKIGLAAYIEWL